ncbi:MAG TPA: SDR family oxidoreductase [Micrococcaceae bacterium]|jgi:uncharacterized protein YbjT (DUF2867 family)
MSRIAIIGGHGKIALHLARILAGQGHQVSSLVRNAGHRADVEAAGATAVLADVEHLSTAELADLLAGHDAVVWSAGAGGGSPERTYSVDRDAAKRSMDAAAAAGLRRYVMVSYFGAGPDHGVDPEDSFYPYAQAKADADAYLKATGLDWTIVAPSALTDKPATGAVELGSDGAKSNVTREDAALVLAEVLASPGTIHSVLEFNNGTIPVALAIRNAQGLVS